MNKKKALLIFLLLLAVLTCRFIIIPWILQDPQSPKTKSLGYGNIYFNPITIFEDLSSMNPVFKMDSEYKPGEIDPDTSDNIMRFSEDEYIKIANNFFSIHWNEEVSDWILVDVSYVFYNCEKGMSGVVLAEYEFEKKVSNNKNSIYHRSIQILPWVNTITWYEKEVEFTSLSNEIDWNKVSITATEAYEISKDYGDSKLGDDWDVACDEVNLRLINQGKNTWDVYYSGPEESLLDVELNARNGEVIDSNLEFTAWERVYNFLRSLAE
jgi:hypothetical protein